MVFLRRLESEDLDILEAWENDPTTWETTDFSGWSPSELPPYSSAVLRQFIENQQFGIEQAGQLRMVICARDGRPVGFVDLYDYDAANAAAGVGILVCESDRGRGYGLSALELLCDLAFNELLLDELWCEIRAENGASVELFRKCGFEPDDLGSRCGGGSDADLGDGAKIKLKKCSRTQKSVYF